MKTSIWLLQLFILIWLLGLSLLILVQPINEYADFSVRFPDCDRDGEDAALLFLAIVWITTGFVVGFSILGKFWRRNKRLWFINIASVILSLISTSGYQEVADYLKQLQPYCNW